jgi:predicted nucleic acid-binding protein
MPPVIDAVFDTNVLIDWLNRRAHEQLILGPGLVRYMSAVVLMELRVAATDRRSRKAVDGLYRAYSAAGRLVIPTARQFDEAGTLLTRLKASGHEIRRSSLVDDVLIALCARRVGAVVYTRDHDFEIVGRLAGVRVAWVESAP